VVCLQVWRPGLTPCHFMGPDIFHPCYLHYTKPLPRPNHTHTFSRLACSSRLSRRSVCSSLGSSAAPCCCACSAGFPSATVYRPSCHGTINRKTKVYKLTCYLQNLTLVSYRQTLRLYSTLQAYEDNSTLFKVYGDHLLEAADR